MTDERGFRRAIRMSRLLCLGITVCLMFFNTGRLAQITIVVTATPSPVPTDAESRDNTLAHGAVPAIDTPLLLPKAVVTPGNTAESSTIVPASDPVRLWIAPDVPPKFQMVFAPLIATGRYRWSPENESQVKLVSTSAGQDHLAARWVYVPVVAFPTIQDNLNWSDFQHYWAGDTTAVAAILGTSHQPIFVTTPSTLQWLSTVLGPPGSGLSIQVAPPDAVVTTLWIHRPDALGIVPFDELDPAMKALTVDGASVFDRTLPLDKYPLVATFGLEGDPTLVASVREAVDSTGRWLVTNRDLSKMTILVMTGTTAMSRAIAYAMETKGITLPARDIKPFLADADLVHTSNEPPFTADCPYPDPSYQTINMRFCARENYLALLKEIHLNIVELTGNHVNDWGTAAFAHTLDLYDANRIRYFGGGRNTADSRKALSVQDHGNTIAFLGCNEAGPLTAWATSDLPGAARCDDDFLSKEIPRLKQVGDLVIMTIQYEEFYQYAPTLDQVVFFQKYAQMGADVVFGSQAHQPQGFAFTSHAFIHYGTGNLFFDQMDSIDVRRMFMNKLIVYDGKHLSTALFTGIREDYSRPRPTTLDERAAFLQTIFKVSGW